MTLHLFFILAPVIMIYGFTHQKPPQARTLNRQEQQRGDRTTSEPNYPEDWQEQRWCCRECGVLAWYSMSPELRRMFVKP